MWKIKDIVITGIITAIAVVIGMFANFKFLHGGVYLLPLVLFLSSIILKTHMLAITTILSVIITDLYTGWIGYTWISLIAYLPCMLFIRWFYLFDKKYNFFIGMIIGSIWMILIYFFLEWLILSKSQAISDFFATLLQCGICILGSSILYYPMLRLKREIL